MPFYKYKCNDCGQTLECLHRWVSGPGRKTIEEMNRIPVSPLVEDIYCGHPETFDPDGMDREGTYEPCGSKNVGRVFAGGSFGIIGGDGASGGGFYSDNLGCYVKSTKHEDEIAHSRGLVRVSDISKDNLDRAFDRSVEQAKQHQADAERFKSGEKLEDIYSVDRLKKDGLLDSNIKGDE